MILSGHQPVYLPGIILFNKIALSDEFMWVGHCQYSHKSYHNHNQIRTTRLTVPVKHEFGQSINDTKFAAEHWQRKHLRSIEIAYSKRPYFKDYFPQLSQLISFNWESLGAMNMAIVESMLDWFDIETEILDSRDFEITGAKTDMLISMCEQARADQYLSNEGARDYVDEYRMRDYQVTHRWQKFTHPTYDQGHREFVTSLSAIDLLFNCGPDSGKIIKECGYVG